MRVWARRTGGNTSRPKTRSGWKRPGRRASARSASTNRKPRLTSVSERSTAVSANTKRRLKSSSTRWRASLKTRLSHIGLASAYDKLGLKQRAEDTYLKAITSARDTGADTAVSVRSTTRKARYADAEADVPAGRHPSPRQLAGLQQSWRALLRARTPERSDRRLSKSRCRYVPITRRRRISARFTFSSWAITLGPLRRFNRPSRFSRMNSSCGGTSPPRSSGQDKSLESRSAFTKAAGLADKALAINPRDADVTQCRWLNMKQRWVIMNRARVLIEKSLDLDARRCRVDVSGRCFVRALVQGSHAGSRVARPLAWRRDISWSEVERSPALAGLRKRLTVRGAPASAPKRPRKGNRKEQ